MHMTQTPKRYTITAYDVNHNQLWITIGSSFVDAEACRRTNRIADVVNAYELVKTGKIIDPETGLPVVRRRDLDTGQRTQGSRRVAYFRIYDNSTIFEIHITRHGRKAGIRNYQTRRPSDERAAQILGFPPVSTDPYLDVRHNGMRLEIVFGEGDPNSFSKPGHPNTDRWGDPVYRACSASRVFAYEVEGHWHGWTFEDYVNHNNHMALVNATRADAERHLRSAAAEMVSKYEADITRW